MSNNLPFCSLSCDIELYIQLLFFAMVPFAGPEWPTPNPRACFLWRENSASM